MSRLVLVLGIVAGALAASVAFAAEEAGGLPPELEPLAALLVDEGRLVDAMRALDLEQSRLIDEDLARVQTLRASGNTEEAEKLYAEAERRVALLEQGYALVLTNYPGNARALTYRGELLYDRRGDVTGAVRSWKMAERLDPEWSAPVNDLAIHYCHAGDYSQGLAYFERLLKLDPHHPDYLYNIAQVYLIHSPQVADRYKWKRSRVYKKAMAYSKQAADLAPTDYELLQDYAVNFFCAEEFGIRPKWAKAAEAWQRARGQARNDDERFYTWLNEARAWLRKPDPARAEQCLQEALAIRPSSEAATKLLDEARSQMDE
ncbi:MAG: tetratricopeptide repeat protein [Candidatus Hydrogenedentes bacterium]|nr:tetratricopeptide repeat protein [Candidatus Hydrogenedentota bacterium]